MESDFKYIPLVVALLAYLGAVRIAIKQRLSAMLGERHKEDNRAKWFRLGKHAKRSSRALMLLMPADIMFVGVACLILWKFLGGQVRGSLTVAIDGGIVLGAAWLFLLHAHEWISGYSPATSKRTPPTDKNEDAKRSEDQKEDPFCTKVEYRLAFVIPVLVLAGLIYWSTSSRGPSKVAEARYQFGRELYDQGRFDAAIVQHQHAIRIDRGRARYHYALAKAVARKNAKYSALAALQRAIDFDRGFREKAKTEPAFEFIRDDPEFLHLVGGP